MKKLPNIRKKLLKQMAFSVFVMAILPLSTRTAPHDPIPVMSDSTAGVRQSDYLPQPGKCAEPVTIGIGTHPNQ